MAEIRRHTTQVFDVPYSYSADSAHDHSKEHLRIGLSPRNIREGGEEYAYTLSHYVPGNPGHSRRVALVWINKSGFLYTTKEMIMDSGQTRSSSKSFLRIASADQFAHKRIEEIALRKGIPACDHSAEDKFALEEKIRERRSWFSE